jgi:hypothetical protein
MFQLLLLKQFNLKGGFSLEIKFCKQILYLEMGVAILFMMTFVYCSYYYLFYWLAPSPISADFVKGTKMYWFIW